MKKPAIRSYKDLYNEAEKILNEKGQATSLEITNHIINNYRINNMNVNGRSITYHLKKKGYKKKRKYNCGGYTFFAEKE